jgi:CRISPR-associated protein Cas2
MSRPDHLFVFAYDVRKDSDRAKLADLLEEHMDRVQFSVFEARMTVKDAHRLGRKAGFFIGPEDSLRIYCIPEAGRQMSLVIGAGILPEADDFVLL